MRRTRKSRLVYSTGQLNQAQSPDIPYNAQISVRIVPDPYDRAKEITAVVSIRDNPLEAIRLRKIINESQYQAGLKWQVFYRRSQIGPLKAIDTTKEPTDGGGNNFELFTDKQIKAQKELMQAANELGRNGHILLTDILGKEMTIIEAATARGLTTAREISYIGRRFRECLEALAYYWGFSNSQAKG